MKLPWTSDDKTKIVESLRKRETNDDEADRKTVAVSKASGSDDDKTLPVRDFSDSQPSQRLSWPARDTAPVRPNENQARSRTVLSTHRDDATRLYAPRGQRVEGVGDGQESAITSASDDPVVGWLVVIEGPGKGRSFELGYGANSIGRDRSQKVKLDFGDSHISREKHAVLVHDPKSMRFFLQAGEARNLTYLGDEVVLGSIQLAGREILGVGDTKLMFVPFCGPDFGWS